MANKKRTTKKPEETISEENLDGKVAGIGEFATRDTDAPDAAPEHLEDMPGGEEEFRADEPEEEKPAAAQIPPEQLKERIISIVSQVGARGLSETEKAAFMEDFEFWNGLVFEILDMGGSLQSVLGGAHVKLTPMKATLVYAGGTAAMIALLRPDLVKKLFAGIKNKQKGPIPAIRTEPAPETSTRTPETAASSEPAKEEPAG